eukprot:7649731-Pyramimonas_sp.AAC.1
MHVPAAYHLTKAPARQLRRAAGARGVGNPGVATGAEQHRTFALAVHTHVATRRALVIAAHPAVSAH